MEHLSFKQVSTIGSLSDLIITIRLVVQCLIEYATGTTVSGQKYVGWDNVSHLITYEDWVEYFTIIHSELLNREEILEVDQTSNGEYEFDILLSYLYCPCYVPADGEDCDEDKIGSTPVSKPYDIFEHNGNEYCFTSEELEAAYRRQLRNYRRQDALNHLNEFIYGDLPWDDNERKENEAAFEQRFGLTAEQALELVDLIVERFEDREDCNLSENENWESCIRDLLLDEGEGGVRNA